MSAGLLLIAPSGASAGPTLASATMALAGPAGLYLFTALVTGALATFTLRSVWRQQEGNAKPRLVMGDLANHALSCPPICPPPARLFSLLPDSVTAPTCRLKDGDNP